MSYDANMVIDTGSQEPANVEEIGNMTYNVAPMFTNALGGLIGLRDLDGKTGFELIPILEKATSHITHPDNAEDYAALNPKNGWGSHASSAMFLQKILDAARKHPKATLRIS